MTKFKLKSENTSIINSNNDSSLNINKDNSDAMIESGNGNKIFFKVNKLDVFESKKSGAEDNFLKDDFFNLQIKNNISKLKTKNASLRFLKLILSAR